MTPDEIITSAQGVVSDYTDDYPTTKSVMYNRMNVRQRELFVAAGAWDREFYGVCVIATLDDTGAVNLAEMDGTANVYAIEQIEQVRIEDVGTSSLATGDRLNIVPSLDVDAHFSPRATIRSHVLEGVAGELDLVTSVKIFYARRPKDIDERGRIEGNKDVEVELTSPFDYLLVWDLARDLIRRTVRMEHELKAELLALMKESESEALAAFELHVKGFNWAREDRFDG